MNEMVTVFVVDDEPILHKLYHDILERKGRSVIAGAYDGEEAVEIYKQMNEGCYSYGLSDARERRDSSNKRDIGS